jgi:DNA-binding Lrp family transcriptional regulator
MQQGIALTDVTVAFVMIQTELGAASDVAGNVSKIDGVRSAVVVTGPYDVIATVRVSDNLALGLVLDKIRDTPGVKASLTSVMTSYYKTGDLKTEGDNGPPY